MEKHKIIRVKMKDKCCIWLSNRGLCIHEKCWSRKSTFKKLYSEGSTKMNEMLDISKILKDIRMTRILLEHSFISEKIKK